MDTSNQLYEHEATGWKRGLFEDVKHTFRAPIVNWIFRTTMANYPEFLRYAWGQLKPAFGTRAFGRTSVEYRDAILSAIESEQAVPSYRRGEHGLPPAEYTELRGQIATFDVVAPRLAVFLELADRSLSGGSVGTEPDRSRAATEPLPAWLDRDRGTPPTMADFDEWPAELDPTVERIRSFHGLGEGLPSVYRCLIQWPDYLATTWDDVEPVLGSSAFTTGCEAAGSIVDGYVRSLPYVPQLDPDTLRERGLTDDAISDLQGVFAAFNSGAVETVIPALPVFAATVDVAGERAFR